MLLLCASHTIVRHRRIERVHDLSFCLSQVENVEFFMYWTLELATYLEDAPWPATKEELIDYAERTGAPLEVIENLEQMEDDGEPYESIEEVWPDYPTADDDFYFDEE